MEKKKRHDAWRVEEPQIQALAETNEQNTRRHAKTADHAQKRQRLIFRSISLQSALFFGLSPCSVVSQGINDHQRSSWRGLQDCPYVTGTNSN
jgi:hypothetical protein